MDIVVCIKGVPMTQEMDLEIDEQKKDINKESLAYVINEWDNYAIEEAIQINEEFGGTVTAITIGDEQAEEVLRRAQAMGAEKAIRVDPGSRDLDQSAISAILAEVIKGLEYDLVLTGVQADDDNCAMVGVMLAERLGLAHACVVTNVDLDENEATIKMELEGGLEEFSKIKTPALLAVQTGINEPRYVSIMGIKKAAKKELQVINLDDLSLSADDISPCTIVEEIYLPPETEGAEMLEGDPSFVAENIIRIMKEKGVGI